MSASAEPSLDPTTDKPPRPRRRIPVSLRMFVAVLGILGVVAGWEGVRTYRQELALREVIPLGWYVSYRWRGPEWLWLFNRMSIEGRGMFSEVVAVSTVDDWSREDRDWTHGIKACAPGLPVLTTDAGLVHLKELTTLERLSLRDLRVTDAGLVHLSRLSKLKKLSLDNTHVTDAGLAHLKLLTSLRLLSVAKTQVTDAGVADLKRALPRLTIVR